MKGFGQSPQNHLKLVIFIGQTSDQVRYGLSRRNKEKLKAGSDMDPLAHSK